jgi:Glycosyl transferase family group 2
LIIRRDIFQDIGLLDEGYYTYFDDIDFCFNARKAGWSTRYVPASRVVHLVGRTTGVNEERKRQPPYLFQARRRYFLKNHGSFYAAMADAGLILGLLLWRLRVLLGKPDFTPPCFLRDSIRHGVFMTGFKLRDVPNPALTVLATETSGRSNYGKVWWSSVLRERQCERTHHGRRFSQRYARIMHGPSTAPGVQMRRMPGIRY